MTVNGISLQNIRREISTIGLQCPECGGPLTAGGSAEKLDCSVCADSYPIVAGRPILFSRRNGLFDKDEYFTKLSSEPRRRSLAGRIVDAIVPGPSVNLSRDHVLERLRAELGRAGPARVLVVGIGREKQALQEALSIDGNCSLVGVDVDAESDADIFCDAHELPFADESFDAIVTTAVLEHVCDPIRAVAEIRRVLKPGGLIYSEIPFMQQVHAGAHDFVRYTRSGHIGLFAGFALIDAGLVAGPGTTLVWSIENFFKLMFTGQRVQQLAAIGARFAFFWLKYFDVLMRDKPQWLDGASCTYFYGKKEENKLSHADLIRCYVGSKYKVTYRASVDV